MFTFLKHFFSCVSISIEYYAAIKDETTISNSSQIPICAPALQPKV